MQTTTGAKSAPILPQDTFLTRERAAEELTASGIPTTKTTLENLAARRLGPPYAIVNGRAIYARRELLSWIESRTGTTSAA